MELEYQVEPEPLGTAGGVAYAARGTQGPLLVLNGDSIRDVDLGALIAFHKERGGLATILLTAVDDPARYGLVRVDADGRVRDFVEKPSPEQIDTNLINAGVYVLEPEVLELIPKGRSVSIEREIFPILSAEACSTRCRCRGTGSTSARRSCYSSAPGPDAPGPAGRPDCGGGTDREVPRTVRGRGRLRRRGCGRSRPRRLPRRRQPCRAWCSHSTRRAPAGSDRRGRRSRPRDRRRDARRRFRPLKLRRSAADQRDVFVPFAGLALLAHAAAGFALLGRHFVLAGICVVVAQAASLALLRASHSPETVGHHSPTVTVPEGRSPRTAWRVFATNRCKAGLGSRARRRRSPGEGSPHGVRTCVRPARGTNHGRSSLSTRTPRPYPHGLRTREVSLVRQEP